MLVADRDQAGERGHGVDGAELGDARAARRLLLGNARLTLVRLSQYSGEAMTRCQYDGMVRCAGCGERFGSRTRGYAQKTTA
jgi:hypothetical protein